MEFIKWPKIARLNRDMTITEKIDGTNAQVYVEHNAIVDAEYTIGQEHPDPKEELALFRDDDFSVFAGSRKRYLTRGKDNFGFAKWVQDNAEELIELGPGRHFGEWWGGSIQRGYDIKEKRFSLFNIHAWRDERPACCHVVPVLYEGLFNQDIINLTIHSLNNGSVAAPGFTDPEGIVVFHNAAHTAFKVTCKNDEVHKFEK